MRERGIIICRKIRIILAGVILSSICTFLFCQHAQAEKDREELTVALTGKYPPFSFYSNEGELVGFDVDVAKRLAEYLHVEPVIVTTDWDGIIPGLLAGKYDAIIGSMAITPERAEKVAFSVPYYTSGAQLFIHERDQVKIYNIHDLFGQKIGVGLGETYEHYLRNVYPDIEVVTYKSTVDIFQDMRNDRIKGFVTDRLVGLYQIREGNMDFIPAGPLLYEENMAIPVTRDNTRLLEHINGALRKMKKQGELDTIHEKWFGSDKISPSRTKTGMRANVIIKKLAHGFGITLFVAVISFIFGFILAVPWGVILNNSKLFFCFIFRFFNDFIRGTPLLIQLFFVYFGAPQVGVTLSPIQAAVVALTINSSAYMSEVVRSGLMAVDYGQALAGRALGLSGFQVFRYIIWPQAFRVAIPPLMNSIVILIKDTSLIAVISVGEVIREAQSIISVTYNPIKYYFIVGIMFFAFIFPLMKLSGKLERSIKKRGF